VNVTTRNYMSIGEVLVTLKTEFPDITISKIRFLEGEGLVDPERTPSGYRKFHDEDVERLRTILRLQRDEYLPLKVIRGRLERPDDDASARREQAPDDGEDEIAVAATGLQMSIEELATATGVERERIRELESFGLIRSHGANGSAYYDGDDFLVLSIAKGFFRYGMEPRHLTMYRHFAEREADLFESIIMPVIRQRHPDARRQAAQTLTDLAGLSRKLKQALLRSNLRQHLQES
jgi:DNA-binding transcriptional MerR regulator